MRKNNQVRNLGERPTGIIRTLPSLESSEIGHNRYIASLKDLERGRIEAIYIAMAHIPKVDVLYMYLLVDGEVQVRLNIAGYEPGDQRECWDRTIRKPRYWAVCTGPVSRPDEPVKRSGFQGFRYTQDLW
jgi:hypothetical protein